MGDEKVLQNIGLIPETDETGQAPAATPALFNGPFGKAQENFDALEPVVQDVLAARGNSPSLAAKMESVDSAIGQLETSDAVSVSNAVRIAWSRSDEGYAVEQFSPNMTLIEFDPINVTRTVQGDDSVDVESTETLKVGNTYVISGNGGQESVTVAEILNATRFKAAANLSRTLDAGKMGQTDWRIHAGYAIAPTGGVYYSSAMSVLRYYGGGMLDIRRDNNEGKLAVKVRTKGGGWQDAALLETVEEEAGTRNEFYKLPVGGIVELQLVADKEIKVNYLMVYTSPEAGRAYPVAQPANLTPAHGAVSVVDPVTLTGTAPRSLYGIAIASVTVQIATDSNMQNIIYSATVDNPSGEFSHTTPGGTVEVDKNYFWDFFYTDEDGNTSPASKATGFSTASVFEYVVPPMIISPANGSAGVMAPLTVRLSDFAAFGSADTHAASRVEASNTPDFSVILFDSGEVAPGSDIRITEADGLAVSTDLYLRPYHKGTSLGWSAAGPVSKVRMADIFEFNYWGDGSDGDAIINGLTELGSTVNGDMVVKNYSSLTIEEAGTLTVATQCRGLLVYVDGDCTIDGLIDMSTKGARCNPADASTTSATPVPSSDGKSVSESGIVFARHVNGGSFSGSSSLDGCGLAAVAAEANQKSVVNGFAFSLSRYPATGKGGDAASPGTGCTGGTTRLGTGKYGALGSCFSGGSGGGGGSFRTYAGGVYPCADIVSAGHGDSGGPTRPCSDCMEGISAQDAQTGGAGKGGGFFMLCVKGRLTINGEIKSEGGTNFVAGKYSTGGNSGGGNVGVIHGGELVNNGNISVAGGTGGYGSSGAPGTITIQQVDI